MKTIQMNPSLNQKLSDPVPRFFHFKPDGLLNTIIFWSGITFWRGLGHDVFEATLGPIEQYEEFNENDWAPFWLYIATNLFKGTLFLFIKFSIGNFLFSAFLFCFLDPLSI